MSVTADRPLVSRPNPHGLSSEDWDERLSDLHYRDVAELVDPQRGVSDKPPVCFLPERPHTGQFYSIGTLSNWVLGNMANNLAVAPDRFSNPCLTPAGARTVSPSPSVTGHNVSSSAEVSDGECNLVRTEWMPQATVERTEPEAIERVE